MGLFHFGTLTSKSGIHNLSCIMWAFIPSVTRGITFILFFHIHSSSHEQNNKQNKYIHTLSEIKFVSEKKIERQAPWK